MAGKLTAMHINIGLWIDHRKAVIILSSATGYELKEILSGAEKHPGRAEGEASHQSFESQKVQADDVRDRKFAQHLNTYYDEVITLVHDASSLLIFGPGEAKGEFLKRLEHEKPRDRDTKVETTDKMTNRQIEAHVREHFQKQEPVIILAEA